MEEDAMDDDSPPCKGPDAQEDDEKIPHCVPPRRADAEEVVLLNKANKNLAAPWVPQNVPMPKSLMLKLVKLSFEDFDTRQQPRLKRYNYMIPDQIDLTRTQILRPMQWAEGVGHIGLLNLLFMPHFGHSLYINTYVRHLMVCFHQGFLWLDRP